MKAHPSTHITKVVASKGRVWLEFAGQEYGPDFETVEAAEDFIAFAGNLWGLDPRHHSDAGLEKLVGEWEGT